MKAAIYCRVSTDDQERDGTSLQTQLEACQRYCDAKGYETVSCFSETYSGLKLERPKLGQIRDSIMAGQVDVMVCTPSTG